MKRFLFRLSFFLWATVLALPPAWAEERIQVVSPPDLASVASKRINLVCRISKNSFDTVRVTIDNNTLRPQPQAVVRYNIHHQSLFLTEGKNRIKIEGVREGKTVEEKVLSVFLMSALSQQFNTPPPAYTAYAFHTRPNEKICSPCHEEELRLGAQSQQVEIQPSCYTCHKSIVDDKFVHGPASVWACATCHKEDAGTIKHSVPDPEAVACRLCHPDEMTAWQSEEFGHGPTLAGKCALCHNPHAADEIFFLVKEVNDLCGSCHEDKLTKPHVIVGYSGRGHPVKRDRTQDGRPAISCVSCHNPHAANNVNLLVQFKGSRIGFCSNCHKF